MLVFKLVESVASEVLIAKVTFEIVRLIDGRTSNGAGPAGLGRRRNRPGGAPHWDQGAGPDVYTEVKRPRLPI
jgi:hypothetical protein